MNADARRCYWQAIAPSNPHCSRTRRRAAADRDDRRPDGDESAKAHLAGGRELNVPLGTLPALFLSPDPPGDTEVYVDALCRALVARHIDASVAAPAYCDAVYEIAASVYGASPSISAVDLDGLYAGDPLAATSFAKLLDAEGPDFVHLHALTPACSPLLSQEISARAAVRIHAAHADGHLPAWDPSRDGHTRVRRPHRDPALLHLCDRCEGRRNVQPARGLGAGQGGPVASGTWEWTAAPGRPCGCPASSVCDSPASSNSFTMPTVSSRWRHGSKMCCAPITCPTPRSCARRTASTGLYGGRGPRARTMRRSQWRTSAASILQREPQT